MANETQAMPSITAPDPVLALWMLERMRDSEQFLGVLRAARSSGQRDVLDTPDYVALHRQRLGKLFKAEADDDTPLPPATAAKIAAVMKRDLLSSPEEFLEKALEAYLQLNPRGLDGIDVERRSVFEDARAEIEGRTTGEFEPGFVAGLASAARAEIARVSEQQVDRQAGLER